MNDKVIDYKEKYFELARSLPEREKRIREEEREKCAKHIESHSCVSSCCDAQPAGNDAKSLADCLRSIT